ncbi:MAG: hypothetical protein ACR2FH_01950 [Caulobacteraceae bacterium]
MPTPTIRWNVDADGDWASAADWDLGRIPLFGDDVAIDTADFHTVTHGSGDDNVHTLTVGNDDFVVSGGSLRVRARASFARGLTISNGTLALGGRATAVEFNQSDTLAGRGTLTVTGSASLNGLQTGRGVTVLQGDSTINFLGLDGGRTLENQGVLTLSGNAEIDLGVNPFGPTRGDATLINDAGGTIDLTGSNHIGFVEQLPLGAVGFANAGTLKKTGPPGAAFISVDLANTGQVRVESGLLEFDAAFADSGSGIADVASGARLRLGGGGSADAGAFTVQAGGVLEFAGAIFAGLDDVFHLGAGTIGGDGTVAVSGGELALGAGAVTIGVLDQSHSTLSGSGILTVTGSANFSGGAMMQTGPGTTLLEGVSSVVGNVPGAIFLDGGRVLENRGRLTVENGALIGLGGLEEGGATLRNDVGGAIDLQGVGGISGGGAATHFINAGKLEKSALPGRAIVGVAVTDTGRILARAFTLVFSQAIDGDGAMAVYGGATLEVDASAAASLSMNFNGVGGTLALGEASAFAATISGFAPGDTIDLLETKASRAVLKSGDRLAIYRSGAVIATLQLTGNYAGATFNVASDGAHGSNITVTLPAATSAQRFTAAMAGLGADGVAGPLAGEARLHHVQPTLCAPRQGCVA